MEKNMQIQQTTAISQAMQLLETLKKMPNGGMGIVIGEPGTGKTAASHFLRESPDTIRICCWEGMSRRQLLAEIIRSRGEAPRGSYNDMMVDLLSSTDKKTLLLDEADELKFAPLNAVRHITDEAGFNVILFGTEITEQTFADPRSSAYLARMKSRIGTKRIQFKPLSLEQTATYVLIPRFNCKSKRITEAFYKVSRGNWRISTDLADACESVLHFKNQAELSLDIVEAGAHSMGGNYE